MSGDVIHLKEKLIKSGVKELVRNSVEGTLNSLLNHEAEELVMSEKYESTGERNVFSVSPRGKV